MHLYGNCFAKKLFWNWDWSLGLCFTYSYWSSYGYIQEKEINKDGENPPATDSNQENDKPELDSRLNAVNQITSSDAQTNGLGGGLQVFISYFLLNYC